MAVAAAQSPPIDPGVFMGMHRNSIEKSMRWEAPRQLIEGRNPILEEESMCKFMLDLGSAKYSAGQPSLPFWLANSPSLLLQSKEKSIVEPILRHPHASLPSMQEDFSVVSKRRKMVSDMKQPGPAILLSEGEKPPPIEQPLLPSRLANLPLPLELRERPTEPEHRPEWRFRILLGKIWKLQGHLELHGTDLGALRAFNRDHRGVLSRNPSLSTWAFNFFLSVQTSMEKILEFLEEFSSKPWNAYHLRTLIIHCQTQDVLSLAPLGKWIEKHYSQKKVKRVQFLSVLEILTFTHSGASTHLDKRPLNRLVYRSISRGLEKYPLRHSMSPSVLKLMIRCISQNFMAAESLDLFFELVSQLSPSQLVGVKPALVNFLIDGPGEFNIHLLVPNHAHNDDQLFYEVDYDTGLLHWLRDKDLVASGVAAECTVKITLRLLQRARDDNEKLAPCTEDLGTRLEPNELHIWFSVLAHFKNKDRIFRRSRHSTKWDKLWQVIEESLVTLEPSLWHLYIRLFKENELPVFFDDSVWIPRIALQWQEDLRLQSPALQGAYMWSNEQLSDIFKEGYEAGIPYIEMVRKARVHSPTLLRGFIPRLLSDLRGLEESRQTLSIFRYLRDREFVIEIQILANEVLEYCKIDPLTALALFLAWPGLQLSHCPGLMEAIISDPKTHEGTAFNVLYRESPNLTPTKRTQREESPLPLTPKQAQTLHDMALAFASAVHLSPRQAFRRVHRCFAHFYGCKEGLEAPLSQALVLSGVIRYLEAGRWVSNVNLNRILDIVRKTEGPEVADEVDQLVYQWRGEVVQSQGYKESARQRFKDERRQSEEEMRGMFERCPGNYLVINPVTDET
ncbi:hypothetical protein MMC14_008002 [Varicellaria rhodocarpa]|nr:hypothetical protein [Varicellaria rhodocarpa]